MNPHIPTVFPAPRTTAGSRGRSDLDPARGRVNLERQPAGPGALLSICPWDRARALGVKEGETPEGFLEESDFRKNVLSP